MFFHGEMITNILKNRAFQFVSFYALIQIIQSVISFFLLPIITRLLPPDQMGIYATCLTFSLFINVLYFLGITEAIYFGLLNKNSASTKIIPTTILFEITLIVFGFIISSALYFFLGKKTILNIPYFPHVFFTIMFSLLYVLLCTYNMILQATEQLKKYALFNLMIFISINSIAMTLMIIFNLQAMSFIYSYFIVYLVVGIYIIFHIFSRFGVSFDRNILFSAVKFSGPLIPHNMAHWVRGNLDKIFLTSLVSPSHTGFYQVALFFGSFFQLGLEGFRLINNPRFFNMFPNHSSRERQLVSILPVSVGFFSIIALFVSLFSYDIVFHLFDKSYLGSYIYVPIILISQLYFLIYLNIVNVLFYHSKTSAISIASSSVAIVQILISYYLVKQYNIWGACLSILFSNVLFIIVIYWLCKKTIPLRWPIALTSLFCLLPAISYIAFIYFNTLPLKFIAFLIISLFITVLLKNHVMDAIS